MRSLNNRFVRFLTLIVACTLSCTTVFAFDGAPPSPTAPSAQVSATLGLSMSASVTSGFAVAPGSPPVDAYSITNNSTLPPGITLDSTGRLSGTPTGAGVWIVGIVAHNAIGWSTPLNVEIDVDMP